MKRLISGIQPSNNLTLGNYLGAIKNFVDLQNDYEMFIFIADLHALTPNFIENEFLYQNKLDIAALYLAAGLDENKVIIFNQSDVKAHGHLGYILMCHTSIGELSRMTQYKDKSAKAKMNNGTHTIPTGLLVYPALMAADILLYNADVVPVGIDQKQHMEITKNIAQRFNERYKSNTFKIPEAIFPKVGSKIMDLLNPNSKMSKSSTNPNGTIFLVDDTAEVTKKIKGAVTDSLNKVHYDVEKQPGISNLITIYSCLTNMSFTEIENKYKDAANYGVFKKDIIVALNEFLSDLQQKLEKYKESDKLINLLNKNAKVCEAVAEDMIKKVHKAINLTK